MKSDQLIDFTKSDDFFHASMVDGCFHCRRWILQKPLQFAIHDSKETIPVLFGTIQCFGDGTTAGAQGGWKLG